MMDLGSTNGPCTSPANPLMHPNVLPPPLLYCLYCRPYMMDLGSTNGTWLNGERIEAERYYELLEKVGGRGVGAGLRRAVYESGLL